MRHTDEVIPEPSKDCIIIPGRIPPPEIAFVNGILDDHEGICVLRTEDREVGKMEFWVAPGMLDQFHVFVEYIRNNYDIPIEIYDPRPESTEIAALKKK